MSGVLERLRTALEGRYRLDRELGAGGMALVYLAEDLKHRRQVALKVLRPELAAVCCEPDRFLREIEIAARLAHPHILPLLDSGGTGGEAHRRTDAQAHRGAEGPAWQQPDAAPGLTADGRRLTGEFLYYVMPYVTGESLREQLRREKQLPLDDALRITAEVADALGYAHAQGVVHCDIKPENILFQAGHAVVSDFGIARAVTVAGGDALTATGMAVGTPAYMSPEQAAGEHDVDARSDIYALGCVLYEMLVGEPPFTGPTAQVVMAKRLTQTPVPPRVLRAAIPEPVSAAILKALAKQAVDRFRTAGEFVAALTADGGRLAAEQSIVVLPFENLSPDPDNAFFADGLTEELIAALSKVRALRVISRTSAMHYKGTTKTLPAVAAELGVRSVLEGSVRRAGNNLRITAQLIDAATDAHLWAETFSGTLDDVFDLQERLARRIVAALEVALAPEEDRRLAHRPVGDVRAYDAWLRAREAAVDFTVDGLARAFELTDHALAVVGDNALLYATQSWLHMISYTHLREPAGDPLARAEALAARALALEPDLPWALFAAGAVLLRRGDLQGFVRHARHALELERDSHTLMGLGTYLAEVGRTDDARRYSDEALALDPLTWYKWSARALPDLFDGRFAEAVARYREALSRLAIREGYPVLALADALAFAGQEDEALALFARASEDRRSPWSDFGVLFGAALRGDRRGVAEILDRPDLPRIGRAHGFSAVVIASCLSHVGDTEGALGWLEQGIGHGFTHHRFLAEHNRFLAPLRGDPRFEALLERSREKERAFEV